MSREVNFFRQAALLLPCAFLLGVLLFLLTHGREDPAFGAYPFFEAWKGVSRVAAAPETRLLEPGLRFFCARLCCGAPLYPLGLRRRDRRLWTPGGRGGLRLPADF